VPDIIAETEHNKCGVNRRWFITSKYGASCFLLIEEPMEVLLHTFLGENAAATVRRKSYATIKILYLVDRPISQPRMTISQK
jgi:hypothetical protein